MEPDYSFLFHQSSKDHLKGHPPISKDENEWPEEWKTVYYKTYNRLPKIPLLVQAKPVADFFNLIKKRNTRKNFSEQGLNREEISLLLEYSCGMTGISSGGRNMRRAQPSGGSRYPIEMYVLVLRGNGLKPGLYHYNVKMHSLYVLWEKELTPKEMSDMFVYGWVKDASVVFLMTSVFYRNQNKYGERGYRYILIEAGHIGQNVYLAAEALGLKCCGMGGTRDENVEKILDIDGIHESVVYALAVGH